MPLTQEDLGILQAHLEEVGKEGGDRCPICGEQKWEAVGIVASQILETRDDGTPRLGPAAVPLVMMTCAKCSLVRQFSWLTIKNRGSR